MPHNQQAIEQAKRDCRHDEHIHRSDAVGMVAEERPPALGRRVSSLGHVLGDAGLSDIDAELEEFSMDPRRPSGPGDFHPESLTDSGLDTLASSGSCHRLKAAAFHWI